MKMDFYEGLPSAVTVNGTLFPINTDFRYWLKFDRDMKEGARWIDVAYVLAIPSDAMQLGEELGEELLNFYKWQPKYPMVKQSGGDAVVDLQDDAPYIYAAFLQAYGIDLMKEDMHWWKFQALLKGLFDRYSDIVGYRAYKGKDKDMLRAKECWRLQQPSTSDPQVTNVLLHGGDFTKGG